MESLLKEHNQGKVLLPILKTPNPHEDIIPWLDTHIKDQNLANKIQSEINTRFSNSSGVPMGEIKKTLEPILQKYHSQ